MKFIIILIGLAGLLGLANPSFSQYRSDSCGCPSPVNQNGLGPHDPQYYDMAQSLSPDGKSLALVMNEGDGGAYILNLQTLEKRQIIVNGGLPGEEDISWDGINWCPYDPDLLALNVISFIDTSNEGVSTVYVTNIFTYRISTGESKIITPNWLQPYGNANISDWLSSSTLGFDTMMISYAISDKFGRVDSSFVGWYSPQTQTLIPMITTLSTPVLRARSANGLHAVTIVNDSISARDSQWFYLDNSQIHVPRYIQYLMYASFSPDSKLVALTVEPDGIGADADTVFEQVWIFSADSASPSTVKVINFQCLYCTYNFLGADAVFLTDSTLAVSMHKDGSDTSALYEITIDGRIVRQLTYVPENDVAESAPLINPSLSTYPNPFTHATTIRFTSAESGFASVQLFNQLGEAVANVFSGQVDAGDHSWPWIAPQSLTDGMYECIVRMNGQGQSIPMAFIR